MYPSEFMSHTRPIQLHCALRYNAFASATVAKLLVNYGWIQCVLFLTGSEFSGGCVRRAGGPWLITDMRRGETIFDIDPHLQVRL